MRPFRAVAALVAWLVQLVWAPKTPVSDLATQAIVGGLILIGGVVLWWLAFKSLWRAAAVARGRSLCRGADVLDTRAKAYRAYATWAAMQTIGAVPALVVVILLFAPQILSLDAIGQALAAAIAVVCVLGAVSLALAGPFGWQGAIEAIKTTDDADVALVGAVFHPIGVAILTGVLFAAGGALWPYPGRDRLDAIQPLAWAAHGLSWQLYGAFFLRPGLSRSWWISVILVPPLVVVAAAAGSLSGLYAMSGLTEYATAYTLGSILWIPSAQLSTVPQILQQFGPALKRVALQQVPRWWP
jgi:hypothetical protein